MSATFLILWAVPMHVPPNLCTDHMSPFGRSTAASACSTETAGTKYIDAYKIRIKERHKFCKTNVNLMANG
jgi:hypothetical protein